MKVRNILIILFFIIFFAFLVIFIFKDKNLSEQEKEKQSDFKRREESKKVEIYGDGKVLVNFRVKVPRWTPKEDGIYVYVDGFLHESGGGGVPMIEKSDDIWVTSFKASANQVLKYKYNRNDFGYSTDEEFKPDNDKTRRKIKIKEESVFVSDEVKKWRWLSKNPPKAKISDFEPKEICQREENFIIGIFLLDFFQENFIYFIPKTLERIKEKGFKYVGIAYSPSYFKSSKPLRFSHKPINTYTEKQMEFFIKEARARGLKILLGAGIETDPDNFNEIESEFQKSQSDQWYIELIEEWEGVMTETAKMAEEKGIEIFTPSNQWDFWGDKTEDQKKFINNRLNKVYRKIKKVYSGKLSSDYYSYEEKFDYYKNLDWIGDKWWWGLASSKEANLDGMRTEAKKVVEEKYKPIYRRYKKPIFLQQIGYSSYDGAAGANQISTEEPEVAEWHPYDNNYPADFQEQADAYEAVFQAIYDQEIFVGAFSFSYDYWDSYNKAAGIRSKPSEKVWQKWNEILIQ